MTDAEILMALDTPYNRKWVIADDGNGDFIRVGDIIDLVNRTQAKNKELKADIERLKRQNESKFEQWLILDKRTEEKYAKLYEEAKVVVKSEARKEFAERLRNTMTATSKTTSGYCKYIVTDDEIDNLLEEMKVE